MSKHHKPSFSESLTFGDHDDDDVLSEHKHKHIRWAPRFSYISYIFVLVLSFDVLSPFTTDVINPVLPIIANENNLHSTPFMIQLSMVAFTLSHAFAQIVFTAFIASPNGCRLSYRCLVAAAIVLYMASSVLCSLASTMYAFIAFRAIQGFAAGFAVLVNNELSRSLYPACHQYLERRFHIRRVRARHKPPHKIHGSDRPHTLVHHSPLTDSSYNYSHGADVDDDQHVADTSASVCYKLSYFVHVTLCLFLLSAIRALVVAFAAPCGALITRFMHYEWRNIFYLLTICGGVAALFVLPILSTHIFRPEISKQHNGLLGITVTSAHASHLSQHSSHHTQDLKTKHSQHAHRSHSSLCVTPRERDHDEEKDRSSKNLIDALHSSPINVHKHNVLLVESPLLALHISPVPPHGLHLNGAQIQEHDDPNTHTQRLHHRQSMDGGSSLFSEQTTFTALSFITNPLNALSGNTNAIRPSQKNTDITTIDDHAEHRSNDTNLAVPSISFTKEFLHLSLRCLRPKSLLLLLMFSCGYSGVLLILCEIPFVLETDLRFGVLHAGFFMGVMVLCLITGSVISGCLTHARCQCCNLCYVLCGCCVLHKICGCCRGCCDGPSRAVPDDVRLMHKCQWILGSILSILFGALSLLCVALRMEMHFDMDDIWKTRFHFHFNDDSDDILTANWIYVCVYSYIFLFGCLVPPLMSLLYASFHDASISLLSLVVHFWRNVLACIAVSAVLFYRERIATLHSNFLHICIAVACASIAVLFFLTVLPLECCCSGNGTDGVDEDTYMAHANDLLKTKEIVVDAKGHEQAVLNGDHTK